MHLSRPTLTRLGAALLVVALTSSASAGPPHPEDTVDWTKVKNRIAWYGTLAPARKAAKKTGRPILLISGAPHCRAVPGVWWPGKQLMDRSYLSDPAVVEASRDFICVRMVTYEDEGEFDFMTSVYDYRTPTKNSLFAIMDPSARRHLVKPGRSMKFTFEDAPEMAKAMQAIARKFPNKKDMTPGKLGLPYLKSLHVGMNVCACDGQRMVVVYATKVEDRRRLESLLTPLAWDRELVGRLLYASVAKESELEKIKGATKAPGLILVEPDAYGLSARQVGFVKLGAGAEDAKKALVEAAAGNKMGSKDSKRHIGRGMRAGKSWEHPVEDAGLERSNRRRR